MSSRFASGITSSMLSSMATEGDKIRENRLRRAAARQGLRLVKSRRRDPRALDYGNYMLIELQRNLCFLGADPLQNGVCTLDDVEDFLERD